MGNLGQYLRISLLLLVVTALGCSSDRLPTYPVRGQVVFPDGTPVRTGSIELKSREHGIQSRGNIAGDGSFKLTTYDENDGAVAGSHLCVVVQIVMVEELENFKPSLEGVVDPRFGSYSTAGLECQVSDAGANNVTITVEPVSADFMADTNRPHTHDGHSHEHDRAHEHQHTADESNP